MLPVLRYWHLAVQRRGGQSNTVVDGALPAHTATMKKKGRNLNHSISQGWWCRLREWPELRLRKGDSFSLAREKMTNPEVFKNYFELRNSS